MSKRPLLLPVFVLVLIIAAAAGYLGWRQIVPPVRATLSPELKVVGAATPLTLDLRAARGGVTSAEVRLVQGQINAVAAQKTFAAGGPGEQKLSVTLDAKALKLAEGRATVQVFARDSFWRPLGSAGKPVLTLPVTVDLTPPALEVVAATQYLIQGGAGVVVLRAPDAVRLGVKVGAIRQPAFPAGPKGSGLAVVMVAIPWDLPKKDASITAFAQDAAGNTAWRSVSSEIKAVRYPTDTIQITDSMLARKIPELLPRAAGLTGNALVEAFLTVNRGQRQQAQKVKLRIGAETASKPLWDGAFLQAPDTKVFANFAQTRTYLYHGRKIDKEVHLGYDLASVKHAPVLAANSGVVAYAGPLTIYGNAVIVDHGLGLQTVYGHLSEIKVKKGDHVRKGQEMGRTGSTGLALGDHLHYEVMIHGISVSPLEWWDGKWIRGHILQPLQNGGLNLFASETATSQPAPLKSGFPAPHTTVSARR